MKLYLNESNARRRFKEMLGQANHFIITALVGLDAIEKGIVTAGPPDLHAVWSPKDPTISARRSRRLILDMALVRAVDALDLYIRLCRRQPCLVQDTTLQSEIDNAKDNSVILKFRATARHYGMLNSINAALMEVMITWRNRRVHSLADNSIRDTVRDEIKGQAESIAAGFSGLDVGRLLKDVDEDKPPTFRETASLIRATQKIVEQLEAAQFRILAHDVFLKELIWSDLDSNYPGDGDRNAHRKRRIAGVWGRDESRREAVFQAFLMNLGLSPMRRYQESLELDPDLLARVSKMVPTEAYKFLTPAGD
jgi:hypothetical protein